jgi:flagellar biosynthesis protein FlhB
VAEKDGQERTESPTQKRLDDARKKGNIPRSRDFNTAAVVLAGGAALQALGGNMGAQLHGMMKQGLSLSREQALDSTFMVSSLASLSAQALWVVVPVMALIFVAALIAPLALGGWSFSSEALMPKFERLSPLAGFKRMFALRSLIELIKALAKFAVVGVVAVIVLKRDTPQLLGLGTEPIQQAVAHAAHLCGSALLTIGSALLIIAGIDVPYQLWQYHSDLKMTREEIREEMKESEGSPEVKGRIRQVQQQMAMGRMMQDVPKADVVVTNPTHYAVALRYDDKRMRAPVVVAKGKDLVAARIRELATEHNVPLFEAPPLARVLHRNVDIGKEIPATLYVAVAQVLSYVFALRTVTTGGVMPERPVVKVEE